MENNNIFDLKRLYLIFKRDLFVNLKAYIIIFGVVTGIYLLQMSVHFIKNAFFGAAENITNDELSQIFYTMFFIIGIIITVTSFSDFRSKLKTQNYLLIPTSTTEKFISAWGTTTIVYIVAFFVFFVVYNLFLMGVGAIFSTHVDFLNVFIQAGLLQKLGVYLILQSLFLAGAATFNKTPILKTPLMMFFVAFVFMILIGISSFLIFNTFQFNIGNNMAVNQNLSFKFLEVIGKILVYITPFVFWAITFFKLKEKQI